MTKPHVSKNRWSIQTLTKDFFSLNHEWEGETKDVHHIPLKAPPLIAKTPGASGDVGTVSARLSKGHAGANEVVAVIF